jgi:hypothetical protein
MPMDLKHIHGIKATQLAPKLSYYLIHNVLSVLPDGRDTRTIPVSRPIQA